MNQSKRMNIYHSQFGIGFYNTSSSSPNTKIKVTHQIPNVSRA